MYIIKGEDSDLSFVSNIAFLYYYMARKTGCLSIYCFGVGSVGCISLCFREGVLYNKRIMSSDMKFSELRSSESN